MILHRLREETRPQHQALEAALPLGRPGLDLSKDPTLYRALLLRFWGFYVTWEAEAAQHATPTLAHVLAARRKLPLLTADLATLGADPTAAPRLHPAALPSFHDNPAALLGSMYVVEGSTLGGQLISRELECAGSFRHGCGYSFFQGYGAATGRQWRSFTLLLESAPPGQADCIVAAAQHTFSAFAGWFAPFSRTAPGDDQVPR